MAFAGISLVDGEFLDTDSMTHLHGGEVLKRWRLEFGWSQKDMAEKLSVPLQTYTQWESGRHQPPFYVTKLIHNLMTEEYIKREENDNNSHWFGKMNRALLELNCPVYARCGKDRIVKIVDAAGGTHCYLTACEFNEEDIVEMRQWLYSRYDRQYDVEVNKDIAEHLKKFDGDEFFLFDLRHKIHGIDKVHTVGVKGRVM